MPRGTYTLVLELTADASVEVGALGECAFEAGHYAYTGSAFGAGGLSRVDRHRDLVTGAREVRHWHVDYLLCHPATRLREVVTTEGADVECAVARRLPDGPVGGFGSSDCDCESHLATLGEAPIETVRTAHERARRDD
ncbi:GIY-YIG nuclease family protein [Salinirubellus salinus]|uniref:GIY-YIG nuclease family protein n=1 Tax=Salinirubellus salinus TaxID=1364945 RepID=A0A9E7R6N2_9EURY|nr:GIY-YIG nuclease family protein [Salinirubellus salinus]UWM56542.1 GIY-YIG nuclease family protein [Salinirubellus salinus]